MSPPAALAYAIPATMKIHSDLLGTLDVAPDEMIQFDEGIFGFPDCHRYVLVATERDGLYWLQSADHSTLAFLLVDPFLHFDDFAVELGVAERRELDVEDQADVVILSIVTLPQSRAERPTANLQGPLALNLRARRGLQLAIAESRWGVRCPVDLTNAAAV
jgi:flagellar assembly factor FliW